MPSPELSLLDEHSVTIAADIESVWAALLETIDRTFSHGAAFCRVVGCEVATSSGPRPLGEGATVPGFEVTVARPGRELRLEGSHRFSRYALCFRLDPLGAGASRLSAESRAEFPGVPGRLYRLLVLRTGAHVVAVRRLLVAARRRAERRARSAPVN